MPVRISYPSWLFRDPPQTSLQAPVAGPPRGPFSPFRLAVSVVATVGWVLALGLGFAALVFQERDARMAKEGEVSAALDPEGAPGVGVVTSDRDPVGRLTFPGGAVVQREGLVLAGVTWKDYQAQPALLGAARPLDGEYGKPRDWREDDFPVVVQANETGFDLSAEPVSVRSAADGRVLHLARDLGGLVRYVRPLRTGGYEVVRGGGRTEKVTEEAWLSFYARLPPPPPIDPKLAEGLTDAQLKERGLEKMTVEEYIRRYGKPPPGFGVPPSKTP